MHDEEQAGAHPDLIKLRTKLSDGLARERLNKTQLAAKAGLGRTVVQEAFRAGGSPPSAGTVAALARALRLSAGELMELRRGAVEEKNDRKPGAVRLGQPINSWEPHDLEVHPAGSVVGGHGFGGSQRRPLPGYVRRGHDDVLAQAIHDVQRGHSRMTVLVGDSSTGKTRACWEAIQPLADLGWWLWHPFDPTRATAALDDLRHVQPRTVVWLNEAQHYLGDQNVGERIAAAVHTLLTNHAEGPVLVLGTLWPSYERRYVALPTLGAPDTHSRVRELLAGRTLRVPDVFDAKALRAAYRLARSGDHLLADALTRASTDGRVTQDLAGASELLQAYEHGTPAARALLQVAMDARRLGVGLLPHPFLTDAALDYLTDTEYEGLTDDWAEVAFAELAQPVHGKQAPLRQTTERPARRPPEPPTSLLRSETGSVFRLADYLEHYGRADRRWLCPPASFWHAAYSHLSLADDLSVLAEAAEDRYRLQWAHHLVQRAVDADSPDALARLAEMREAAGDRKGAEDLAQNAADVGNPFALLDLARMRKRAGDIVGVEELTQRAADAGNTYALFDLADMREEAGDRKAAEEFLQQALDAGNPLALGRLAEMREEAGDREGAKQLAQWADDAGHPSVLVNLAVMWEKAGNRKGAEDLAQRVADAHDTYALVRLATEWEKAGNQSGAEDLAQRAADAGNTDALLNLAQTREGIGDRDSAEFLLRKAAEAGNTYALLDLAERWGRAGNQRVEDLVQRAAESDDPYALTRLALEREEADDHDSAMELAQRAADAGNTDALFNLVTMREEAGDHDSAEDLLRKAADAGLIRKLALLTHDIEQMPDWENVGNRITLTGRWPFGLDPDGTPTSPWH
ncbi:helix-turn-helix domain-containing protein [Streptomyces sp. NPDC059943]|uniref:helix-turn-helix domain-containing protein n=1 Tax=Streptomyces sp. NPDC059943 TaxID=3347010 RepID=UPI003667240F